MVNSYLKDEKLKSLETKIDEIKRLCKETGASLEIIEQLDELADRISDRPIDNRQEISAQLSIYPLRQPSLSKTINEALKAIKNYGLKLIPGSMSTMIIGNDVILWEALKEVFRVASTHGELVMIVTLSNACPKPEFED